MPAQPDSGAVGNLEVAHQTHIALELEFRAGRQSETLRSDHEGTLAGHYASLATADGDRVDDLPLLVEDPAPGVWDGFFCPLRAVDDEGAPRELDGLDLEISHLYQTLFVSGQQAAAVDQDDVSRGFQPALETSLPAKAGPC